mgnify:FL=1
MSNTTKAIRASLVDALTRATNGDLSAEDGRNIIGLANQISQSMGTEVKVMTTKLKMGHQVEKFGDLRVS